VRTGSLCVALVLRRAGCEGQRRCAALKRHQSRETRGGGKALKVSLHIISLLGLPRSTPWLRTNATRVLLPSVPMCLLLCVPLLAFPHVASYVAGSLTWLPSARRFLSSLPNFPACIASIFQDPGTHTSQNTWTLYVSIQRGVRVCV
jgi:hypothetical protein